VGWRHKKGREGGSKGGVVGDGGMWGEVDYRRGITTRNRGGRGMQKKEKKKFVGFRKAPDEGHGAKACLTKTPLLKKKEGPGKKKRVVRGKKL